MSIRQKLIILFLAISFIPIALVILTAYITIHNELTSSISAQLATTLNKQAEKMNVILYQDHSKIIDLSIKFELRASLANYLTSKDSSDRETLERYLTTAKAEAPEILSLTLVDFDGNIIVATNPDGKTTLQNEPYFINAKKANIVMIAEDKKDRSDKLYISYTIFSGTQEPLGIIIGAFSTDKILAIIKDYTGLGDTGETILAERDASGKAIALTQLRFDHNAAFKRDVTGLQRNETNSIGKSVIDYRGKEVVSITRKILSNWSLTTKIDTDEVFTSLYQLRITFFIIFFVFSCVVILLGLHFANIFTAPIILLTEKTKKIIEGDFTQKIDISSTDEIGMLGVSFNNMTTRLAQLYQALAIKVQEKTAELSKKIAEVEQQKAKDDAILVSISNAMIVTGQIGEILFINEPAAQLLDLDSKAINGRLLYQVFALYDKNGDPLVPNQRPEYAVLHLGKKIDELFEYRNKGNAKIMIQVTATPVIQQGKIIGSIVSYRDVTKEREVDRMKTEFISLASHQLRTPLSAIKWFTEMLLNGDAGKLNPEQEEFARNISSSTERMIQLVSSLLNISRIESGRIMVDPQPTDLKELVQGIVNDLKAKLEERHQNLIISVHEDLPKINLDPRLISQVYMNLLTNAIKYTPKGGDIQVFISKTNDQVVSQVTDNGYGIPKAQQEKIFQKFFRAENIAKVETDGTGLGLYLIKAIIESSSGKIWFKSEEGKGTTFWFSLPLSGMKPKKGEVTLDK